MAVRQLKDGRWIVYYKVRDEKTGKLKYPREYFGRGPQAKAAAQKRNDELGLKKPGTARLAGPSFVDLAKAYSQAGQFNKNSLKHLKIRLAANILPALGNKDAARIGQVDLDRYVQARRGAGRKYSTIRREITDIKAILNWAAKFDPPLIPSNPVASYKAPMADDAVIMPPTPAEIAAILKHAKPHLLRVIWMAYFTGQRVGAVELFAVPWPAVNWDSENIQVLSAAKGKYKIRKPRWIPLHPDFIDKLNCWYEDDLAAGWQHGTIVHYYGRTIKSIKKTWKQCLTDAGIVRRIRPYDLRHQFVTAALERGVDVKALANVVGSNPETLRKHYQHVTRALERQTVEAIDTDLLTSQSDLSSL